MLDRRRDGWHLAVQIVPATLAVLAILLALVLAYQLRQLLILSFVALLIAAALHDPARWLETRRLPRPLAAAVPYLALGGVITLLVVVIFPPLLEQAAQLVEELPSITDALLGTVIGFVDRFFGVGTGQQVVDQLTEELAGLRPDLAPLLMLPLTLFEVLLATGMVLFLSYLLIVEREPARRWFLQFLGEETRPTADALARNVLRKLGAYVRGQLLVMTVVGVTTTIGMIVLGVPFALPLGLLAFLVEAIPLAGPFIAAVPILGLAFLEGPDTGLLMLAWLVIVQQAEGWALTPLIQGKVLSLSPMAVLLAVFAGGTLGGIVGAVIAVPIVAVVDVLIRDVVVPLRQGRDVRIEDGNGEPDDRDAGHGRRGEEDASDGERERGSDGERAREQQRT